MEEGEDFRLEVRKKHDSDWPHPTMRVFWYTDAIAADETDYEHLYAERQSSNGSQSESGVMGRNFHTLDDQYPEIDETFKVQFNNSVDYGHDGECIITIADDDGVGIYDLAITSEPGEITTASGDEGRGVWRGRCHRDFRALHRHGYNVEPGHRRACRPRRSVHTGGREPQSRNASEGRRQ